MNKSITTEGQSLLDVTLQELGTVAGLFDLADANGLAITDALMPGQSLAVPASPSRRADVVGYFQSRAQRINTGALPAPTPAAAPRDFKQIDFSHPDFS